MLWKLLVAVFGLALAGMVATAKASVLTYKYQGQDLVCVPPPSGEQGLCSPGNDPPDGRDRTAWTGNFVFDEALLPGGSIAGLTFTFDWVASTGGVDLGHRQLAISDMGVAPPPSWQGSRPRLPTGGPLLVTYAEDNSSGSIYFDWSEYGVTEGSYGPGLFTVGVGHGHFIISFDANKQVSSWWGWNEQGCGCIDPSTDNGIDRWGQSAGDGYLISLGPGTWKGPPAPVPIPAALPLFATALGGMGFIGWRRKRLAV